MDYWIKHSLRILAWPVCLILKMIKHKLKLLLGRSMTPRTECSGKEGLSNGEYNINQPFWCLEWHAISVNDCEEPSATWLQRSLLIGNMVQLLMYGQLELCCTSFSLDILRSIQQATGSLSPRYATHRWQSIYLVSNSEIMEKTCKGDYSLESKNWDNVSDSAKDLVRRYKLFTGFPHISVHICTLVGCLHWIHLAESLSRQFCNMLGLRAMMHLRHILPKLMKECASSFRRCVIHRGWLTTLTNATHT